MCRLTRRRARSRGNRGLIGSFLNLVLRGDLAGNRRLSNCSAGRGRRRCAHLKIRRCRSSYCSKTCNQRAIRAGLHCSRSTSTTSIPTRHWNCRELSYAGPWRPTRRRGGGCQCSRAFCAHIIPVRSHAVRRRSGQGITAVDRLLCGPIRRLAH